jgi:hypoxanthine phosphoribosyltransferase
MKLHSDIESIRITETEIASRVAELGAQITREYEGKDLVMVGVLTGATLFLADLVRRIDLPMSFDFVAIGGYTNTNQPSSNMSQPSGVVRILKDLDEPVESKHVLIIEDVIDPQAARRLSYLMDNLRSRRVASVRVCTLLDKPSRRQKAPEFGEPDYCGFVVEEEFVVGYGLDYQGRYRSLPYVGVLKSVIYGGG